MSMSMPAPRFHYFFDLPAELRELILQHICLFPDGIFVGGNNNNDAAVEGGPPLGLFLASSRLLSEASGIYYGQNTFHFDCRRGRVSRLSPALVDPETGLLTSSATAASRRRIRAVVVYVSRLGAMVGDVLVPVLRGMVIHGGLRVLEVRVEEKLERFVQRLGLGFDCQRGLFTPVSGRGRVRNGDGGGMEMGKGMGIGTPLRMLLGLLADPYLDQTHVRILREHRGTGAVCPYHMGSWCKSQRPAEGWSCWVDVDVKGLLEVYGGDEPEFRILSVG
ncbi:hypothetical protein B0T19DRAFT_410470 [Cercophora scortea]|uniref:Uncharacterized protein n=1 Tax=Cercophora scortea TaxID=314031 RepID=A0AAE0J4H3_9PEZI|nr:hypothetical protein B0T19DRAFT_410470 [Cercophora scortea]